MAGVEHASEDVRRAGLRNWEHTAVHLLTGVFVLVDELDLESPIGEREPEWKTDVTAATHDRDFAQ